MSGDIFGCQDLGGAVTGIEQVEAMGAAKHPTMDKTAPPNEELSGPKFQ